MTHQAKTMTGVPPLEYACLARAWLFVYALLYFAAAVQGMGIQGWTPLLSAAFLISMGVLSLLGNFVENRWLRILLSGSWAYATVSNWMKIIPWIPTYSDLQYTVMALLNMVQAVCLAYLGEVWKLE